MPKCLMGLGILLVGGCVSDAPNDYEDYAHHSHACDRFSGDCKIVQSSPLCGEVDRQTCRVIVYEAQESDKEQGYGTDRRRVRSPHGFE